MRQWPRTLGSRSGSFTHAPRALTLTVMIQIIEDDVVTCQILSALLKRLRLPCCEARTGEEALEQLRSRPIDLVIADMMLPDMHGLELLAEKHRVPYLRDIPVLCCTAQADLETVEKALGLGAVDFVKKPIDVRGIAARITRAYAHVPRRWESWGDLSKRLRCHSHMLPGRISGAQRVVANLAEILARPDASGAASAELDAAVTRARLASMDVGAVRTVQILHRLWGSDPAERDVAALRAALVIELAAFDEAVTGRPSGHELAIA